nr:PqqD family protein [Bacteroidota bacterium]
MRIKTNIAVSDSGFIFNPDTGESFTVNPIGALIIAHLKEGKEDQDISNKIRETYNVEFTTFEKDFDDFIGLLKNYSLVENGD